MSLTAESKKSGFSTVPFATSAKDLFIGAFEAVEAIASVFGVCLSVNKDVLLRVKESV